MPLQACRMTTHAPVCAFSEEGPAILAGGKELITEAQFPGPCANASYSYRAGGFWRGARARERREMRRAAPLILLLLCAAKASSLLSMNHQILKMV